VLILSIRRLATVLSQSSLHEPGTASVPTDTITDHLQSRAMTHQVEVSPGGPAQPPTPISCVRVGVGSPLLQEFTRVVWLHPLPLWLICTCSLKDQLEEEWMGFIYRSWLCRQRVSPCSAVWTSCSSSQDFSGRSYPTHIGSELAKDNGSSLRLRERWTTQMWVWCSLHGRVHLPGVLDPFDMQQWITSTVPLPKLPCEVSTIIHENHELRLGPTSHWTMYKCYQ